MKKLFILAFSLLILISCDNKSDNPSPEKSLIEQLDGTWNFSSIDTGDTCEGLVSEYGEGDILILLFDVYVEADLANQDTEIWLTSICDGKESQYNEDSLYNTFRINGNTITFTKGSLDDPEPNQLVINIVDVGTNKLVIKVVSAYSYKAPLATVTAYIGIEGATMTFTR